MRWAVRWVRWTGTILVLGLASGCSSTAPDAVRIVQPGAPGEDSRELAPDELQGLDEYGHSARDVAFMQAMMLHHVQALQMTRMVPDRTDREDLPLLAQRIDVSQEAEIEQMRQWLETRDEQVPSLLADHDHADVDVPDDQLEPGMLTRDQLRRLEGSAGVAFDRLFLEFMIFHHQGALRMVEELFAAEDGGSDIAVSAFANDVVADQTIEIGRMERMLAEIDASGATSG